MASISSGLTGAPNPLMGWQQQAGVNPTNTSSSATSSPFSTTSPVSGQTNTNPYGLGTIGGGSLASNLAETNLQTGQMKNQLIPAMSQAMFGAGGAAGNFFNQLMNLGSPYYQQQQQASFNQGNTQAQNAAAQARQQLASQGYGATPSGAEAGMIGGMAQQAAGNLNTTFLQNLFNNEQLQLQAAQGLSQLASLFNPAQLAGGSLSTGIQQPTNTAAETLGAVSGLLSGAGGQSSSGAGFQL